jgi:hypothetical protein
MPPPPASALATPRSSPIAALGERFATNAIVAIGSADATAGLLSQAG